MFHLTLAPYLICLSPVLKYSFLLSAFSFHMLPQTRHQLLHFLLKYANSVVSSAYNIRLTLKSLPPPKTAYLPLFPRLLHMFSIQHLTHLQSLLTSNRLHICPTLQDSYIHLPHHPFHKEIRQPW